MIVMPEQCTIPTSRAEQNGKLTKNQRRKLAKKAKKKAMAANNESHNASSVEENSIEEKLDVEVEYVSEDCLGSMSPDDPNFATFVEIFKRYATAEDLTKEKEDKGENDDKAGENRGEKEELNATKEDAISRKQQRKQKRLSVAELKQLVERPDVVEAHDVTSGDPRLLVFLKAYRNTVPVPRHWCHKRKYLQGKRGVEKAPFQLPAFIAQTGIEDIRSAVAEEDEKKKGRTKARERVAPKMGRVDIDYQVLHDAFFRFQTKPKLTIHGDVYYEGKEFEVKLNAKIPGNLSEELKKALGMTDGIPPPWLLHMQRYGPPPSYPNLKIPGLNAPIPDGASFGYHPGGWGKPPVDEFNRPLYGDVFAAPEQNDVEYGEPISKERWGELQPEEESEEEEEEEENNNGEDEAKDGKDMSGMETPMDDGISSSFSGMDTPGVIDLRKGVRGSDTPQELFTELQQKESNVGGALYGSSHNYAVPGSRRKHQEGVEVALDATELEGLDEDTLKKKYEAQLQAKCTEKEDVSDILEEEQRKRKRKAAKASDGKSKKYKDFKF